MEINQHILNNLWVNKEIKEEIIYMEIRKTENTMIKNLWDTVKAILRKKYIAIQTYLKKQIKSSSKQFNLTPKGNRKRINKALSIKKK